MTSGPRCFHCGALTPLRLRRAGLLSKLPTDQRGSLPYCRDHEAEALARRDKKFGSGQSEDVKQGRLL